ncbi:hypothetical protein Hanom_Chr11g01007641 [Helianthus anomalus]
MKDWYNSRNTTIDDVVKRINDGFDVIRKRVNILWGDRCKQQEVLFSNLRSLDLLTEPPVEPLKRYNRYSSLKAVLSLKALCLAMHPVTGEILEEGETVADLLHEQLLALNAMKEVDDAEIVKIPNGTEFAPFNEEWLKENVDVIDEQLKNRDASENATDAFTEWRKQFLSEVSMPMPAEVQVDYLQFEKVKPHGKILCWMFVKEIHCMAIKRVYGIQYFSSLLAFCPYQFTTLQL